MFNLTLIGELPRAWRWQLSRHLDKFGFSFSRYAIDRLDFLSVPRCYFQAFPIIERRLVMKFALEMLIAIDSIFNRRLIHTFVITV
jgi:hypothetical protein